MLPGNSNGFHFWRAYPSNAKEKGFDYFENKTLNALTMNHYKLVVLVIDAYQTDCALRHLQKFLVTNMVKINFKLWIWSMLVNHEIF